MLDPNDHVIEYVDAYLHKALSSYDAQTIEQHCQRCPICQVALDEAQKRFEALQQLPEVRASEELLQKTEAKVLARQNVSFVRKPFQWAWDLPGWHKAGYTFGTALACAFVYLLTSQLFWQSIAASPYDLRVMGQTQLIAATETSLRIVLSNRNTGEMLENVPVTIELIKTSTREVIQLASFKTDAQGTASPKIQLPDWQDGEYGLQVTARPNGQTEVVAAPITLKRSWQILLTTDKPVYQPGQTIHMRSIALKQPNMKPVAGSTATFRVLDPKGNVVFQQEDVTSRFGIAFHDCALADEIIEGTYQIECQVGETLSTRSVEVKKYVLPKFKVTCQLDKPYYQPGDTVHGTIQVDYFFGKPVAQAKVEVQCQEPSGFTARAFKPIATQTDAEGKGAFDFVLPDSLSSLPQESDDSLVEFNIEVTDSAGQTQSTSVTRKITTTPIKLQVIPESRSLVKGIANRMYILATYADGRPADVRIAVNGLPRELQSSDLGVAVYEFVPSGSEVSFQVKAIDELGDSSRKTVTFTCGSSPEDFLMRLDKATYNAGETMHITALGSGHEPVFIDLLKDNQTVLTGTINMVDGKGQYAIDLSPELSGTLQMSTYRLDRSGVPVRNSRVLYVRPARQLQIQTTFNQKQYRPGETATLSFHLTDRNGKPKPGAISLAAVDEAVYSVTQKCSPMQRVFNELNEQLLKPVYAIYPWSPYDSGPGSLQDHELLEQAIFANTSQDAASTRLEFLRSLSTELEERQDFQELFDRPDWEELIPDYMPPEVVSALRNETESIYPLDRSTYPDKARSLERRKKSALQNLRGMWHLFGLAVFISFFCVASYWSIRAKEFVQFAVIVAIIVILIGLMLPAVQQAREASRRMSAVNDLKQIAIAAENFRDSHGGSLPRQADSPSSPVRVRQWYPETLVWRPELITDDQGNATIEIPLADSITKWRVSTSAITAGGQLGSSSSDLKVFQPFFVDLNLPVALTREDEISLPVVLYNYLDKPQTVELNLVDADWFESLDEAKRQVELQPNEVRSVSYQVKATQVGQHQFEVTAVGGELSDAIRKDITVVPDGRPVDRLVNASLHEPAQFDLTVPEDAVQGSAQTIVKLYPSTFSHVVEGLDGIFQRPYGCFEQTSSTTYPNVLALEYLRRSGQSAPGVEAKARQYIHLGYQRLLSFEVYGGGFDWFGNPPANLTLTAYGLMEFKDMAKVHAVDPELIRRTEQWLLDRRQRDGSWAPESHRLHDDPTQSDSNLARLTTTAYIAWALLDNRTYAEAKYPTRQFLLSYSPDQIDDTYTLALVCNALLAIDPTGRDAKPYLERLQDRAQFSLDRQLVWWDVDTSRQTIFYGAGQPRQIETTAIATLALLHGHGDIAKVRGALAWLVAQKDSLGTWHSTQATVLALKCLVEASGKPLGGEKPRRIEIRVNGKPWRVVTIPADQFDVVQQFNLSDQFATGTHQLSLQDLTNQSTNFQMSFRYFTNQKSPQKENQPLDVQLQYDRLELATNESITATAIVTNQMDAAAPMVMLDLPIPPGFSVNGTPFEAMVASKQIAKYQITPRSAIVYLRRLDAGKSLTLAYQLQATMPVNIQAGGAVAYEYYDEEKRASSQPVRLVVHGAES